MTAAFDREATPVACENIENFRDLLGGCWSDAASGADFLLFDVPDGEVGIVVREVDG